MGVGTRRGESRVVPPKLCVPKSGNGHNNSTLLYKGIYLAQTTAFLSFFPFFLSFLHSLFPVARHSTLYINPNPNPNSNSKFPSPIPVQYHPSKPQAPSPKAKPSPHRTGHRERLTRVTYILSSPGKRIARVRIYIHAMPYACICLLGYFFFFSFRSISSPRQPPMYVQL